MKSRFVRSFIVLVVGVLLVVLVGCPSNGTGSGGDTSAPTFGGLTSVTASGLTGAVITWDAASDDTTSAENIVYEVWQADIDTINTGSTPTVTTAAGVTSAEVTVPGFKEQFFLVQAVDEAGNRDGNTVIDSVTTTQASWSFLDGGGANDGVEASGDDVFLLDFAELDGTLYAAWIGIDSEFVSTVRISRFDGGTTWTSIADSGLSVDSGPATTTFLQRVSLVAFDGRLYVSWTESELSQDLQEQVQVAMYDPDVPANGWTMVDGDDPGGVNIQNPRRAGRSTLVVYDGSLYIVWNEERVTVAAQYDVFVAKYNGNDASPAWSVVGDAIDYSAGVDTDSPDATVFNDELIVVWEEAIGTDLRAKSYDSSTDEWTDFDGGSLNRTSGNFVDRPRLVADADTLYLFWYELEGDYRQLRARAHDGSSWTMIDGDLAAGLNYDDQQEVYDAPAPFVLNGQTYVAYVESASTGIQQTRVLAFNGNIDSPDWQFVDGGSSTGLNLVPETYDSNYAAAIAHDGALVVGWVEPPGATPVGALRVIQGR